MKWSIPSASGACGLALLSMASIAHATTVAFGGDREALSAANRAVLEDLLSAVGVTAVNLKNVERSPERQVRVMLALAEDSVETAKAMYCDAGDAVIDRYDSSLSRDVNFQRMLKELNAQLPRAREMGCLNHIRNADVVAIDLPLSDIPEAHRAQFQKLAEAAVAAGKVQRFLAPPREPDAFHFEFARIQAEQ